MTQRYPAPIRRDPARTGSPVVVVGVDGSDRSWRAVAYAAGVARCRELPARMICVYVAPPCGWWEALVPQLEPAVQAAGAEIAAALRAGLADRLDQDGLDWEFHNCRGSPYLELTKIACAVQADTVVVGATGSIARRLIGSIAVRLVRCRQWPVIVVP